MKRVSQTMTYPATTVADVYAMLGDPAYRKAVADYQGVQDFACEIVPEGNGMRARLEEAHGTDRFPSFARRLVGDQLTFVREETWTSPSGADVLVTIPGKPGEMTGNTTLTASGDGVVQQIDLTVKVSLPLVGGKVEELVAGFVTKAFAGEHEVGVTWLRGERPA